MDEPHGSAFGARIPPTAHCVFSQSHQPLDWQRFYDFILYAFGHEPPSAEAVGHALVQNGLDWDEAEPFMLFYKHAVDLLLRQATLARKAPPARQREAEAAERRVDVRAEDTDSKDAIADRIPV